MEGDTEAAKCLPMSNAIDPNFKHPGEQDTLLEGGSISERSLGGSLAELKEKGLQLGDPDDKCLCCIPINSGVKLIGASVIIYTIFTIFEIVTFLVVPFFGIVYTICELPVLLGGYYFYAWF